MKIRSATKGDASAIAHLLFMAMEDIVYAFINQKKHGEALAFLEYFVSKENNQYSYENIFVAEVEGNVVGAINVYDGGRLDELRQPVLEHLERHYSNKITVEDETEAGEWYLDTLGVNPEYRGMGIGGKLIHHVIQHFRDSKNSKLGLLVDEDNPRAFQLYTKLGFAQQKSKTLVGKRLNHLQYTL